MVLLLGMTVVVVAELVPIATGPFILEGSNLRGVQIVDELAILRIKQRWWWWRREGIGRC